MKEGRPLAYLSHALKGKAVDLSIYENKILALVYAIKKWRSYILNRPLVHYNKNHFLG